VSCCEFQLQQVLRRGRRHAHLVARSLVAAHRTQLGLAPLKGNALLIAGNTGLAQVTMNACVAVDTLAVLKGTF
jgi:hypothetical protein